MRIFRNIINITVWTVVAAYVAVFSLSKLPGVQEAMAKELASVVAEKLGTRVTIGRVNLGLLNRVIIDNVVILDQSGKPLLATRRMSAKVELSKLATGQISIASAQLIGARITAYQTTATAKPSFQFVIDSLASKDTTKHEKTKLNLRIGSFIMHHTSIAFDKHFKPQTPGKFNPSHLKLYDISANVVLRTLTNDSLNVNVKKIALKEQSGFRLDKLSFEAEANRSQATINGLDIRLPHTDIKIGKSVAYYVTRDDKIDLSTLRYSTSIEPSTLTLADIGCFQDKLNDIGDRIEMSAEISGTAKSIVAKSLDIKSVNGDLDLDADGWINMERSVTEWQADVRKLSVSARTLSQVAEKLDVDMESWDVNRLGIITTTGTVYASPRKDITAQCQLTTDIGDINMKGNIDGDKNFKAEVEINDADLGALLDNKQLGMMTSKADIQGRLPRNGKPTVTAKGTIALLEAKGHSYENISLEANLDNGDMEALLNLDDPALKIDIEGTTSEGGKMIDIAADIRHFNPAALNLTKKWNGDDIDLNVRAKATANSIVKVIDVEGGFGNISVKGDFNPSTLKDSYLTLVKGILPGLPMATPKAKTTGNTIHASAEIVNTDIIASLLDIPLSIEKPIKIEATMEDGNTATQLNIDAPQLEYDDGKYENLSVTLSQPMEGSLECNATVTKLMKNDARLIAAINATAKDNKIKSSLSMTNDGQSFAGKLNTTTSFYTNDNRQQATQIDFDHSELNIDGVDWSIAPAKIVFAKDDINIDNFSFSNGNQYLKITGRATPNDKDSLKVTMNGIDVAYVLNLVNFHSVDFGGMASGDFSIKSPFNNFMATGKLRVDKFTFENGRMGTLYADAAWNQEEKQIEIDATADDGDAKTFINGYVSPSRNYIDLDIKAQDTRLDFAQSFTKAFLSNVEGRGNGAVRLVGPLSAIDLLGSIVVDAKARVTALGCDYTLAGDTLKFVHDDILFEDAPIYDRHGNMGIVNGGLHHTNLKRMTYDLDIRANNLLAYDFDDFGDQIFYATVYATGDVRIHGVPGLLDIKINATPERNTTFVYNVSNPDAIADQEFIEWNDVSEQRAGSEGVTGHQTTHQASDYQLPTDVRIDFIINCNQNATVKLLMDSQTNDYITLNGDGVITANYYNNGPFKMTGTYRVNHGTYGITIQNIIKKNFLFDDGGTIVFGGDPFDAALNLKAIHTVNGVSLSDLNLGNSFKSNTIRVNCIMNIAGVAKQPSVTFDLDLPTLGTDEKQMVKSIINGEESLNQQVVYLLGIGRFYPQGSNNATAQGENQQDQTSLAMQSLLSGTISSQINSLLGTVINNNNWSFGANISTGDEGWNNAEYEGLLSGRLLNNRLLINGQFGYRDSKNTASSSFIGDFDIRYLLTPNGNLALKVYNQTNDRYFTKSSLNTQGVGLIIKRDFNRLGDLFGTRKKTAKKKTK